MSGKSQFAHRIYKTICVEMRFTHGIYEKILLEIRFGHRVVVFFLRKRSMIDIVFSLTNMLRNAIRTSCCGFSKRCAKEWVKTMFQNDVRRNGSKRCAKERVKTMSEGKGQNDVSKNDVCNKGSKRCFEKQCLKERVKTMFQKNDASRKRKRKR